MPTLRPARLDERLALEELMRRASLVWVEYRDALLAHPEAIEVPAAQIAADQVRVAELDGRVVGFSAVLPVDATTVELDGLFVDPEVMRGGVGRALIEDAAGPTTAIEVTANPRALGFYQRVGFVETGRVETRFGPGIRMRRERAAVRIEAAEVHAWSDMIGAAPASFAAEHGLAAATLDGAFALRCRRLPFVHFNCVLDLGLAAPARPETIDRLARFYAEAGVASYAICHNPACAPVELPAWLAAAGLAPRGGWDRIHRNGAPLAGEADPAPATEPVSRETAAEWAAFIDDVYGLPTSPWLVELAGRPGWHHELLRDGGRVIAARSMFIDAGGDAWLGIDAPVPGLMTQAFGRDQALCRALVRRGLALGARSFTADIEQPSPAMDTPAYALFAGLGFRRVYGRTLYMPI